RSFLSNTISAVLAPCSPNESTIDCKVRGELTFRPRIETSAKVSLLSFRLRYDFLGLDEAVGIYRDRVDTALHQKRGELWIIAWRFAADAHFAAGLVHMANDVADDAFHCFISFIEQLGELTRIAIDSEDELREIVAADGKAVEALCEFLG